MKPVYLSAVLLFLLPACKFEAVAPKSSQEALRKTTETPSDLDETAQAAKGAGIDRLAYIQKHAIETKTATWGYWGNRPSSYSSWTNHANRLIPIYVFGSSFSGYMNEGSVYRNEQTIQQLYGRLPPNTVNQEAIHADQTDVYRLQRKVIEEQDKRYIFLVIFDGMDWQTTRSAAIYKTGGVSYSEGKGSGLSFQDYDGCRTDFGFFATGPYGEEVETDVDAQQNLKPVTRFGGYDSRLGGKYPWSTETDVEYLIGRSLVSTHAVTDSSSSATSMTAGVKTINGAINLDANLQPVETIAQWLQRTKGFSAGTVTSVPFCHATPAAAYAANVSRDDYQDLARDMLGLPSVSRRTNPSPGLEVVIGCGVGENTNKPDGFGSNFIPGNKYITADDLKKIDVRFDGPYSGYVIAERTSQQKGSDVLSKAATQAAKNHQRLFGYFGVKNGHLPFQTADGDFKPVADMKDGVEVYSAEDLNENPNLTEMTQAAIEVLEVNPKGFWLMVEAGDVDWANHANNIDSSIGAVLSGEAAVRSIFDWIEQKGVWDQSLVIVTGDHGHYFHLVQPEMLIDPTQREGEPRANHK
jgi:alkaline phosphatase